MFDEPSEDPENRRADPLEKARSKSDEFRMHAELAAVFEGNRKFDAQILLINAELARECQKMMGKLEKARLTDTPVISPENFPVAAEVLDFPNSKNISTNDYHVYRRPGEVMMLRWLEGEQVETYYTRLQAHFDAAMTQFKEDERQSLEWKQDPQTSAYLSALDAIKISMEEKYLRAPIREHNIFVLSTQVADEMDILHLCDFIMGIPAGEIVGESSAPPDEPSEKDRAWFFKLFSLRGNKNGIEQMCFFTYLQKSNESDEW